MNVGNFDLGQLISWLKQQDPNQKVKNGFGYPHTDRGYYENLAFDPVEETTFGEMLDHAQSALGETFEGWKGGDFEMDEYSSVLIGEYGKCGEHITSTHLKYWLISKVNE